MTTPTTEASVTLARSPRWVLWACVAVAVVMLSAGAYFTLGRNATRNAKIAREAVAERRFDDARLALATWMKSDPNAAEAQYLLARVELAEGRAQEAMNALGKALDLGHPAEELATYRAVIQANADQFDAAEPILRRALAASKEPMPDVAKALARVYLSTFRLPRASAAIARWMRDDPDDPEPYLWQNEIETRSDAGRPIVIANFREALRRDPTLAKARFGLADTLRQEHHLDEAAEEFAAYLEANPNDPNGHLGAGRTALEQGRFDDGAKSLDRVLEINPNEPYALKERGSIELKRGNHTLARDFLLRAIAADPYDPDAHYNLQLVFQRLGDKQSEARHKTLALRLRDDHARINSLKGQLVKKPKDVPLRVQIVEWLLEHGHDDEGLQMADQVLHDAPANPPMLRLLIDYHVRKRDQGKANYYRLLLKDEERSPAKSGGM